MIKGINQFMFPDSIPLEEAFSIAKQSGYDAFELCMGLDDFQPFSYIEDPLGIVFYKNPLFNINSSEKEILRVKSMASEQGIKVSSVGSILSFLVYPLNDNDPIVRQKSIDCIKKSIDAAALLEAESVLVIPGAVTEKVDYLDAYKRAQESLCILGEYASKHKVTIAVENVWNCFLYSPIEMARFIDEINNPWVGIYLDVGNMLVMGYPDQWIKLYQHRLKRLHIKDFRRSIGNINGFVSMFDGDVDWDKVMSALLEIGYDGEWTAEIIPASKDYKHTIKQTANAIDTIFERKVIKK